MSSCITFTFTAQLYVIDLGGWLMRKSWKIYEKVYKDIAQLYDDSKRNGKVKVQVDETNVIDQEEGDAGRCYWKCARKVFGQCQLLDRSRLMYLRSEWQFLHHVIKDAMIFFGLLMN